MVALKNPGTDYTIGGVSVDVSNIENEEAIEKRRRGLQGDRVLASRTALTTRSFTSQLYELGPLIESAGLSVGSASAAAPPVIAGPSISQALTQISGTYDTLQYDTVSIDPNDVTGQIVLRISFDDATDTLTNSFSLDGGATFQSPFPPMPAFVGVSDYEFLLGGGVIEAPAPANTPTATPTPLPTPTPTPLPTPQTVGLQLLVVKNPAGPTSRKIVYKVRDFGHAIAGTALDNGATLNIKLDATTQCFYLPTLGWSAITALQVQRPALSTAGPDGSNKKSGNVSRSRRSFSAGRADRHRAAEPACRRNQPLAVQRRRVLQLDGGRCGPTTKRRFKAEEPWRPRRATSRACTPEADAGESGRTRRSTRRLHGALARPRSGGPRTRALAGPCDALRRAAR